MYTQWTVTYMEMETFMNRDFWRNLIKLTSNGNVTMKREDSYK